MNKNITKIPRNLTELDKKEKDFLLKDTQNELSKLKLFDNKFQHYKSEKNENDKKEFGGFFVYIKNAENNKFIGLINYIEKNRYVLVQEKQIFKLKALANNYSMDEKSYCIVYTRSKRKIFRKIEDCKSKKIVFYNKKEEEYCEFNFAGDQYKNKTPFVKFLGKKLSKKNIPALKKVKTIFFDSIREEDGLPFGSTTYSVMQFPLFLEQQILSGESKSKKIIFPNTNSIGINFSSYPKAVKKYKILSDFIRDNKNKQFICPLGNGANFHATLLCKEFGYDKKPKFTYVDLSRFDISPQFKYRYSGISEEDLKESVGLKSEDENFVATQMYRLQGTGREKTAVNCTIIAQEFLVLFYEILLEGKSPFEFVKMMNKAFWAKENNLTLEFVFDNSAISPEQNKFYSQAIQKLQNYWDGQKYPEDLKYYFKKYRQLRESFRKNWVGDLYSKKINVINRVLEREYKLIS